MIVFTALILGAAAGLAIGVRVGLRLSARRIGENERQKVLRTTRVVK